MKKGHLFIPKRDQNRIALPKSNNLSIEQVIAHGLLRYKKALTKLSKL